MNIERLLDGVQKPGRYIGREHNSVTKEWTSQRIKVCLSYPDVYEVGMSYLGIRILYHLLNNQDDVLCERVFAPWPDMEGRLRTLGEPLFSLESRRPLEQFDILGFSFGYELTYTNFLNILDLGRIPLYTKDRNKDHPIIMGGGPCVFNPLVLSPFVDIFFIGEAEDGILPLIRKLKDLRSGGASREEMLARAASFDGLYVPLVHDALRMKNRLKIKKQIIKDFENSFYPDRQIVPLIKTIHDRIPIEIMRGCPNRCRFCQAEALYRPLRIRSRVRVLELMEKTLDKTGYEEVSFLSLSSSNYPDIAGLLDSASQMVSGKGVNIAVPSLRIEDFSASLPSIIARGRKTGLTFAPEAGSLKMREKLNKRISIDNLFEAAEEAFRHGWKRLKLYFMIGLPGESTEDLDEIPRLAYALSDLKKGLDGERADLSLSINNFIPKPHTAFQWEGMEDKDSITEKQAYLKGNLRGKRLKTAFQDIRISFLEGALSRGDELLSRVIYNAWRKGARFDSWTEYLNIDAWESSFKEEGISLYDYPVRRFDINERLPWDFIDTGLPKADVVDEFKKSTN